MARNLAAANLTESQAANLYPLMFAQLHFDEGVEYLHTAIGPFTWGGDTYTGVGDLGKIEPIEEGIELSPYAFRAELSGLDSTIRDRAQNSDIYGRDLFLYLGFLLDGVLVADPDPWWLGTMDTLDLIRGATNTAILTGEQDLKFFDRPNGIRFNDEHQQKLHSGDLFFEFLDQMQNAEVIWGGRDSLFNYDPADNDDNEPDV